MARALRITHNETDYNITILNTEPITKNTIEIPISFASETITLIKTDNKWQLKEAVDLIDSYLIDAIGKAIGLRYRL